MALWPTGPPESPHGSTVVAPGLDQIDCRRRFRSVHLPS